MKNPAMHSAPAPASIAIVGRGSAGMISAIAATRAGARVLLLERLGRIGKKLLTTGNGRCNLTNLAGGDPTHYHGREPSFPAPVLAAFPPERSLAFFADLGIVPRIEDGGQVYPWSNQAAAVLDVLRLELERLAVPVHTDFPVTAIERRGRRFHLRSANGATVLAERVILACGGCASPFLGSDGSGYALARGLGHSLVPPFPVLVPLKLASPRLGTVQGLKWTGGATILDGQVPVHREEGEFLFTAYGISGPAIFRLGRCAGDLLAAGKPPTLHLDLFPETTPEQLAARLLERRSSHPERSLETGFTGMLPRRLAAALLRDTGLDPRLPAESLSPAAVRRLVAGLKGWSFPVTGTMGWDLAQVTAGGIDSSGVDPLTLESRRVPGLYFAGEILDVDGDCGGFNLQWAWASGTVAGQTAATAEGAPP